MIDYIWMWSEFLVRWLHVVAGIAWIGSSFYFIALDLSLKPGKQLPDEAHGQAWQVHARFYNMVNICTGAHAGRADLVQMGGLHDLAVGFRAADADLLHRHRAVSDRCRDSRHHALAGHRAERRRDHRKLGRL